MRGATSLSLARIIGKQLLRNRSKRGGIVPSLKPRERGNEETIKKRTTIADDNPPPEPIVVFSRPPPMSPFLGPVAALSYLSDSWSRHDNNEA